MTLEKWKKLIDEKEYKKVYNFCTKGENRKVMQLQLAKILFRQGKLERTFKICDQFSDNKLEILSSKSVSDNEALKKWFHF